ncbi:MAG TPA: zinc ABC transporter substrate-binding protein [Chlamydiales bacterium]|nr:zinc ABC transporter substrate-binding protein [Chlamydiales bacterium]
MISGIFVFFILLAGCASAPQKLDREPRERKPLVLVSVAPYRFLIEKIGEEAIDVETIIPSHSNPHAFEPTSKQVLAISRGQIWFRIGEPFEEKLLPMLRKNNPELAIYDLREGIELQSLSVESDCDSVDHLDRHIWLSPKLAAIQAQTIAAALQRRFPENRDLFQKNLDRFLMEIEQLDAEVRSLLEPVQERKFIVSHPAFGYFCREYHLEQLSIEQEGKDPRPRYLEEVLKQAQNAHVALALALPQHNNKGAQLIASKMNVPIRVVDPYSPQFFDTVRHLACLLANPYCEDEP